MTSQEQENLKELKREGISSLGWLVGMVIIVFALFGGAAASLTAIVGVVLLIAVFLVALLVGSIIVAFKEGLQGPKKPALPPSPPKSQFQGKPILLGNQVIRPNDPLYDKLLLLVEESQKKE